jgi:hypothetical protein
MLPSHLLYTKTRLTVSPGQVEHCWTLVKEDREQREKTYSVESEAVHSGDAL